MSLRSWGNYPKIDGSFYSFSDQNALQRILDQHDNIIPYGNGRSYGDSALNEKQIYVKPYNCFLDFDNDTGILKCQSGVLLAEIIDVLIQRGWFLSVTPGTKLITVGGAIASDVHGKNHHVKGSFSDSVIKFRLMLPNGEVVSCSRDENKSLFEATCGGMGLTGVILDAIIQMLPVNSCMIDQVSIKTGNLKETFEAFEKYKDYAYSVAWIDCLSVGKKLGRSLVTVGEHASDGDLTYTPPSRVSVPFELPSFVLNKLSVKAFNALYYGKARAGVTEQKVHIDNFFYPLDAIDHWNRIYGRKGFTQYQFVLPLNRSYDGLEVILHKIACSGKGSFLSVLKQFGKGNSNWLSFPMEGYTLALDFKIEPGLFKLLDAIDKIVLEYGGRFYLAKDARVSKDTFEKGYRNIERFRNLRKDFKMDETINSLQSKRVGL